MDGANDHLEFNTANLINVSLGPQMRPDSKSRQEMLQRLKNTASVFQSDTYYPNRVITILAAILVFLAGWFVQRVLGTSGPLSLNLPLILVILLLTLNLIWVPIAGIIIIRRRRYA